MQDKKILLFERTAVCAVSPAKFAKDIFIDLTKNSRNI